jgi:hypothetical protein
VTTYILVDIYQRYGGSCCIYLQGKRQVPENIGKYAAAHARCEEVGSSANELGIYSGSTKFVFRPGLSRLGFLEGFSSVPPEKSGVVLQITVRPIFV